MGRRCHVDIGRLENRLGVEFLAKLDRVFYCVLRGLKKEPYNRVYFDEPSKYRKRIIQHPSIAQCIYPPNLAVMDWYLNNKVQSPVLDRACGMGPLIACLDRLGIAAYGYDTWEQIPKQAAKWFLRAFGLSKRLIASREIERLQPTAVTTISYHWGDEWMCQLPSVRWVLTEPNYVKEPETFGEQFGGKLVADYGMLYVFERKAVP